MKKILVFLAWTAIHFQVAGQEPNQGLYAGFGMLSDVQLIAEFSDTYSKISSGISGDPQSSDYDATGPFILGYHWFTSRRFTVGPEFNLVWIRIRERYSSGETVNDKFFFANLSARCDFRYVRKQALQLYSGIALGGSYIFDQSDDPTRDDRSGFFPSYQINLFGIRFGREWAGYAEFGFGRNGMLTIGISRQMQE